MLFDCCFSVETLSYIISNHNSNRRSVLCQLGGDLEYRMLQTDDEEGQGLNPKAVRAAGSICSTTEHRVVYSVLKKIDACSKMMSVSC